MAEGQHNDADRAAIGRVTLEQLAEYGDVPGNERVVRQVLDQARPRQGDSGRTRVCVRLVPSDVPLVDGETLAIFVRTHDRGMAESVAEAVLHERGLRGAVIG